MEEYLDFAVSLALKAGEMIRTDFRKAIVREWKADETPITTTDRKINQMVIEQVAKRYPTYAILAEEGSRPKESEYAWVCDPIDGTVPFSNKYPTSVFALALTKNGESMLGVIYDPYMDRLLTAVKGQGAYCNKERIHVSESDEFNKTTIDVEAAREPFLHDISKLYELLLKKNSVAISLRSVSYGGMLVGIGQIAAVVGAPHSPWDGAASKVIVEEALGKVTDLFGNNQRYDRELKGIIISNSCIHDAIIKLVRPLLEKKV
ncbi:MAG: inositol monophosphatase [Candidatus Levybacteria bacterium]|nr:inositol monophosphatase [Candidatus Levybacteria bacterium]